MFSTEEENANNDEAITKESETCSVEYAQALVIKYVEQLLNGCGNEDCTEVLCHTGRLNTSSTPVRKYTPRSARTIAVTICSAPRPELHLCRFYGTSRESSGSEPAESVQAYDQSSLTQLLAETSAMKQLNAPTYPLALELKSRHDQLDRLLQSAFLSESDESDVSDGQFAGQVLEHLKWLVAKLPPGRTALWEMVDREIISRGRAYPQKLDSRPSDDRYNAWLPILDVLDDELYLRLLQRVVSSIARRMAFERLRHTTRNNKRPSQLARVVQTVSERWYTIHLHEPDAVLALVVWLKKLFSKVWKAEATVKAFSVEYGVLEMLRGLEMCMGKHGEFVSDMFLMPVIWSRLGELELAKPLLSDAERGEVCLLDYPFLFPDNNLFCYFRTVNHLVMREAHSASLKAMMLRQRQKPGLPLSFESSPVQAQYSEEHYLLLNVSRTDILKDTCDQLWQRRKAELRRPLRVRLGHDGELEVGHDLGGVQIEFFNVVCRQALSPDSQLFTTYSTTGMSYFCAGSLQPLHMFELFGIIFALAIYNGIVLPIRLPAFFYALLAAEDLMETVHHELLPESGNHDSAIAWVSEVWPTIGRSLTSILDEDVEGLEFSFPLEANGLRLSVLPSEQGAAQETRAIELQYTSATAIQHHQISERHRDAHTKGVSSPDITAIRNAWPGWELIHTEAEPAEVTANNKRAYVDSYIRWLLLDSIAPQLLAFLRGFRRSGLVSTRTMKLFSPSSLRSYIEGDDFLDISQLKAATEYDGYEKTSKYIQNFWRIVTGWTQEKQKQLLKFVTAAERIPITGASHMTFMIKKAHPDSIEALPTSSTCFGTLLLPRYASSDILAQKLDLALKYGTEGFGTG